MLGGFDTNVAICVLKPKKFVRYEQKFLRRLLVMICKKGMRERGMGGWVWKINKCDDVCDDVP